MRTRGKYRLASAQSDDYHILKDASKIIIRHYGRNKYRYSVRRKYNENNEM
jgi:hypothetical protein